MSITVWNSLELDLRGCNLRSDFILRPACVLSGRRKTKCISGNECTYELEIEKFSVSSWSACCHFRTIDVIF